MERQILAVSDVNQYIKNLLDRDGTLSGLCVRGEISNYKVYLSGHHYFTLKDSGGALRAGGGWELVGGGVVREVGRYGAELPGFVPCEIIDEVKNKA